MSDNVRYLRQSVRVLGPFDGVRPGVFDMPVKINDLGIGGCFVNSMHAPPEPGQIFTIHINLPTGETIVAHCETASVQPGYGYGVRFCDMSADIRMQLERAIDRLKYWKATLE
jgi:hypothetical protein